MTKNRINESRIELVSRMNECLVPLSQPELRHLSISVFCAAIEQGIMTEETIKEMAEETKKQHRRK